MKLHFINTGKAFPYGYYLSVLSALKTQQAEIVMWLFDQPEGAYWNLIKPKVETRKAEFPDFRALKNKDDNFRMAHMVDWCRWKVLFDEGGMFMDMDTLALKDMSDLLAGWQVVAPLRVKDMNATAFPLNNSFVGARKGSPLIWSILRFVEGKMNEPDMTWGDTGPLIFNTILRENSDKVRILPQEVCEPYRGGELLHDKIEASPETRMIHVCGASNKAWKDVSESWMDTSNVLYARLARSLFTQDELHPFGDEEWLKAKGLHYRPLFDYLTTHPCRNIVEIGTYDGENALRMIKRAALVVPENEITYVGFDLFEDMDERTRKVELSHPDSPCANDVMAKLQQTKAWVSLVKGNTKDTLEVPSNTDLVFLDGGHSVETIAHDWSKAKAAKVVFFDDYFPDRIDKGCKTLVDSIKGKVFPRLDSYKSGVKSQMAMVDLWEAAQASEASFWRVPANMSYGQVKQEGYVDMMGLEEYGRCARYDLQGKTIIDVGGGPCSLLLRCYNFKGTVIDPCDLEPWVYERYAAAGIKVIKASAEDWEPDGFYDEAWCYNVLQHVRNPQAVVDMMKRAAKKVRVFEWIDTPTDTGHPNSFTTEDMDKLFGQKGTGRNVTPDDFLYRFLHTTEARVYYGVFAYGSPRTEKYRFHYPGLVHVPISERYMACAFTQKIVKLSKMLLSLGHEVYLYGAEGSDAPCTEFVQTHTLKDIRDAWGDPGNDEELGYDWRKWNFRHDFNAKRKPVTLKHYANTIEAINARKHPDDFLLLPQGFYHKPVSDAVKLFLTCEPGIGYHGVFTRFKAFESAALQNFSYGSASPGKCVNGNYYDRVIPNYFDPADFPLCEDKGDYYLFVGRMIQRKGVWTAIHATQAIGAKLILAGQETDEVNTGNLPAHCKFIGYVDRDQRAEVMGHAKGVFVPTLYLESFGGVNVEAQLCGTPAITTNFGCFPETVKHGVTGFLCNTLQDFVDAAKKAPELDPFTIHTIAMRYAMNNVRHEYQNWFDDLYQLYRSAYCGEKGWSYL